MRRRTTFTVSAVLLAGLACATPAGAGETATSLHSFGANGYSPWAGITLDRHGNILGDVTLGGGGHCLGGAGCGAVFRLVPPAAGRTHWTYETLYDFRGAADGSFPTAPITPGPDGALYGYTADGSNGTVFRLAQPATPGAKWTFTILYVFQGGADGDLLSVSAPLLADNGSIYGIASGGTSKACGQTGCGSMFRLDPAAPGASWTKTTLVTFNGANSGRPQWIAGPDANGAVYVTTDHGKGAVVQLAPPDTAGAQWQETILTSFAGGLDGRAPGGLLLRNDGTLFGLAAGTSAAGNLVYQLTPPAAPGGAWTRSVVAYVKDHGYGADSLAFGPDGTLIGAIEGDFDFFAGSIFRLTPPAAAGSAWTFTEVWNFNRGPDRNPLNAVAGKGGAIYSILNGGDSTNGSLVEIK
jgi:hypothetical protein